MSYETEITADEGVPLIVITRTFDAPPELVWRAFTDPELFVRWVGPDSITTKIDRWDARTGGEYRYVCVTEDGEETGFYGSFHEMRPYERGVQTFTWEGVPDGVALETMTLVDLGDGRTRVEQQSLVDSFEGRDAILASGMDVGVDEGYAKLDKLLAQLGR